MSAKFADARRRPRRQEYWTIDASGIKRVRGIEGRSAGIVPTSAKIQTVDVEPWPA
jgi:hypothetical protein